MAQALTPVSFTAWSLAGPWGAANTNIGLYTPEFTGGVPSAGGGGSINIDDSSVAGGGSSASVRQLYSGAAVSGLVTVVGTFGIKFAPRNQSSSSYQLVYHAKCELALADQNGNIYPLKVSGQTSDYIWEFDNTSVGWNSAMSGYNGSAPNATTGGSPSFTATATVTGATALYLCVLVYYKAPVQVFSDDNYAYSSNACAAGITVTLDSASIDGSTAQGGISVNDNGTIKSVGAVYVNDNGTIKQVGAVYVNDNGTIKQII